MSKKGNEIVLARIEVDDYFGEQALLTAKLIRRNVSARTFNKVVKTFTISHSVFRQFLKTNSKLKELLKE
ncbi:hypothetical protein B1F79_00775 [Coxiella-like endosymbiont of Rhipicephalus sanguineus]|uniref:hypothetical protein n=1 Tax=Coxiella-like endosymbiont of Rhipicephalus sanguineus TaxID=1955402 RepID=UPI00203A9B83|nr:hypothetical protein [Coxiella-like endosymbiont of Rhipicephalus sanguineus]MBT8506288.1 hypothetical protein [Coxiella-like endosymbiont of Rhipicephalus sanguineus]